MENKTEDEIIRRWQAENKLQDNLPARTQPPRKRRREDISDSDLSSTDEPRDAALTTNSGNVIFGASSQALGIEGTNRPLLEWVIDENGGHWKDGGASADGKIAQGKARRNNAKSRGQGATKGRVRGSSRK